MFLFLGTPGAQWSQWALYTECSVTCGTGVQSQRRHCLRNDVNKTGEQNCKGPEIKNFPCYNLLCLKGTDFHLKEYYPRNYHIS